MNSPVDFENHILIKHKEGGGGGQRNGEGGGGGEGEKREEGGVLSHAHWSIESSLLHQNTPC